MKHEIGRREFLKQGSLAGILATGHLAGASPLRAQPEPAVDTASRLAGGSSPGVLEGRQLDSGEFCRSTYDQITPSLGFAAPHVDAARRWQTTARAKLVELMGSFPTRRVDLRAETIETTDLGSYVRERIVFQTRENLAAIGYLLLPKQGRRPFPTILCLSGHGRGADEIVGLTEDGRQREAQDTGYAKDFAVQAVNRGYAAFALEQLAFGARRDAAARRRGPQENSCRPAACAALLFGQTMIGWRVWDVVRTIDYLSSRPEIDAGRIATMGISGGGTVSLFAAAVDERIRVAVVSAYFNTFRDSLVSISHCPDNYVPGLLNYMEMYDLAGLVAPRALFVEAGVRDSIFPIHGTRTALAKAQHIYRVFGAPERIGHEIHDGGHEFHGAGAFDFLERWG